MKKFIPFFCSSNKKKNIFADIFLNFVFFVFLIDFCDFQQENEYFLKGKEDCMIFTK